MLQRFFEDSHVVLEILAGIVPIPNATGISVVLFMILSRCQREREKKREKLFRDSFRDPPELTLRFRSSERGGGGRERMEKWLSRVSIASEEVIDAVTSSIDSCMSGLRYDFLGGERVHEELLQNPEGS